MKKNVGNGDKTIRIIIALALLVPVFMGMVTATISIIFSIGALILLLTAFISFCPIWRVFGISTRKKEDEKSK